MNTNTHTYNVQYYGTSFLILHEISKKKKKKKKDVISVTVISVTLSITVMTWHHYNK